MITLSLEHLSSSEVLRIVDRMETYGSAPKTWFGYAKNIIKEYLYQINEYRDCLKPVVLKFKSVLHFRPCLSYGRVILNDHTKSMGTICGHLRILGEYIFIILIFVIILN